MSLKRYAIASADWFCLRSVDPQLAPIQLAKLARQLPLLYVLLIINALGVAYTHHGVAPALLSAGVSAALCVVCGLRAIHWARNRHADVSVPEALSRLRRITFAGAVVALAFVAWALALNRYGGPYEQGHVAFFIAITAIGCLCCLMHLPQAAVAVTLLVVGPYLACHLALAHPVFVATGINLALVALVMIQVLANNYRAFAELETSKAALALEQAQTLALNLENGRLANTDSLTGLPNRRAFFAELEAMIAAAEETGQVFAVATLDLDGFKPINDRFGHTAGDGVLIEASRRLLLAVRGRGMVARLGGDEFGLLFPDVASAAAAAEIGRDLCESLAPPMQIEDRRLSCQGSCGLVLRTQAGQSAASLYDQADFALYHVKAEGRGTASVFSPEHQVKLQRDRAIEAALLTADLVAEMEVYFQPIIDHAAGAEIAMEALARWNSPKLGRVPPDRFIAVAERTGLIRELTPVLLRKALQAMAGWPREAGLSFNLSAHDIMSAETVLLIVALVRESGIDPARITLEITETALMRDFDLAREHITVLRALGLRIALDDFGVGYSSLSCVHRLPLDKIKVDRSFVQDVAGNAECRNVIRTILDLCGTLGLDCIVEGIETAEQCAIIVGLGARQMQGYHFAMPQRADELSRRMGAALSSAA